jgi:exosome complex component RRP40
MPKRRHEAVAAPSAAPAPAARAAPAAAPAPTPAPTPPPLVNQSVFPGDELCAVSDLSSSAPLLVGTGVVREGESLRASRIGVLRYEPPPKHRLWVEGEARRYVPALGDHVIGIVESKHAEEYRLHLGGACAASLPVLAFDGATKRNRPHLEVGALVYARVVLAHRDMEPECSCAAPPGVSTKDWVTKESVFGELSGGQLFACPQPLCRRLLGTDDAADGAPPVLDALGALAPFEFACGANNRVWLSSASAAMTVLAQSALLQSHGVADDEHEQLVVQLEQSFELPTDGDTAAAAAAANAFMQSLGPGKAAS